MMQDTQTQQCTNNSTNNSRPIVWSIAASDSGGGAGIQADLKTIHSLMCHGCTVITAITAQNSLAVEKILPLSTLDLSAQWQALAQDLAPKAIKVGLLPTPDTLSWLAAQLEKIRRSQNIFCVWDPVLKASTGAQIAATFTRAEIDSLLQQIDLITPNLQEAERLTAINIQSFADIESAAQQLLARGVKHVLIKGGHSFNDDPVCRDYYASQDHSFWLTHAKQDQVHNHGTGCTLASAIASFVAQGSTLSDSLVLANRYIQQALRLAAPQGQGAGPVWQGALENQPADLCELIKNREQLLKPDLPAFPRAEKLGLYAIVNSLDELQRLMAQGINTFQWRDKGLASVTEQAPSEQEPSEQEPSEQEPSEAGSSAKQALKQAITLCREKGMPLYINDHWQLALEFEAYGLHLGQEDLSELSDDDLQRIQKQGLYLGISCHNETELAYALHLKPSYLAFGPVFTPKSKVVDHPPLGLNTLARWQASYGKVYPTTCIGGIEQENLAQVLNSTMDSIAVISAVQKNATSHDFIAMFQQLTANPR